jgi:Glycosyltransferase (GlcNAc)
VSLKSIVSRESLCPIQKTVLPISPCNKGCLTMGTATIDFDGKQLEVAADPSKPVEAQVPSGDGSIYVSIVSYRGKKWTLDRCMARRVQSIGALTDSCLHCTAHDSDGERCGATLKDLFENAKNPDKVFVGLVEQNHADDKFCVEEYCASFGSTPLKRQRVRQDVTKIVTAPSERAKCPHLDQIRLLGLHHYAAKGPAYARSFTRKLLANEEFCMQVDAHSAFAPGWDDIAVSEWKKTSNEFAVISHLPVSFEDKGDESYESSTPRQCKVYFRDNGFPVRGIATGIEAPRIFHAAHEYSFSHLYRASPRTMTAGILSEWSLILTPHSCRTRGRLRFRLPSVTWKKAPPTIRSRGIHSQSNRLRASLASGREGKRLLYCRHVFVVLSILLIVSFLVCV